MSHKYVYVTHLHVYVLFVKSQCAVLDYILGKQSYEISGFFFENLGFFSRNRNHRLYWPKVRQQFRGQAFHINHVVEDACSQHFSQVPVHKCTYILGLLISILTHLTSIYCSTALLWFPCLF